jgi:alcohol dehydrogenase class IV
MATGTFRSPFVEYGPNASNSVGRYGAGLGKKALIVTDRNLEEAGLLAGIKQSLTDANLSFAMYDKVTTEPLLEYVQEGLAVFRKSECDFLVSVGGGSCIDTAKGISGLATNTGSLADYEGRDKVPNPGVAHIAIPTTAGTGSEVSPSSTITDPVRNVKMLIMSPHLGTRYALVDPLLTMDMPQSVTASSGIDALTHAMEGYISVLAHPLSDALNLTAIRLLCDNLPQAWADGTNLEARSKVMNGALIAGMGFCNSSVALVHGLARPLGGHFHVAHGIANAVLLPAVTEFSILGNPVKYATMAEAMGEKTEGLSPMDAAHLAVTAVKRLCTALKVPTIGGLGISKEDFEAKVEQMAHDSLVGGSSIFNPRKATLEEMMELYRQAY